MSENITLGSNVIHQSHLSSCYKFMRPNSADVVLLQRRMFGKRLTVIIEEEEPAGNILQLSDIVDDSEPPSTVSPSKTKDIGASAFLVKSIYNSEFLNGRARSPLENHKLLMQPFHAFISPEH